jgi:diguanylate cyclase (GGDEF)-like protein
MDNIGLTFLYLYMFFLGIYVLIAGYCIISNPKKAINRVGFALMVSLCFWVIGFMFSVSAPNYEIALFWRRVAVIGWGSAFSLFLHGILIITNRKRLLKKWWIYVLIYLPAVIILYFFSISYHFSSELHHLVLTHWKWVNYSEETIFDIFYQIYYLVFFIISFALFADWGLRSKDKNTKRQAKYVCLIFSVIVLFKIIVNNSVIEELKSVISLFVPIVLIIPILGWLLIIKKYKSINNGTQTKEDELVEKVSSKKIYLYLTIAALFGGTINFVLNYICLNNRDFSDILFFSLILFLFGISIHVVRQLNLIEDHKDTICAILVAMIIPMISIYYFNYGNNDVWAFPFILILAYLTHRKKSYLLIVSASIMITYLVIFIFSYDILSGINTIYFFTRVFLFAIAIVFALYLHKIFVLRLNQNIEKIRLQKMIAKISTDCVRINKQNFKEAMGLILKECSEFFLVNQAKLYLFDLNEKTYTCFVDYSNLESELLREKINTQALENMDIKIRRMLKNEIDISEINNVGFETQKVSFKLKKKRNNVSQIMIPIMSKQKVVGFLEYIAENQTLLCSENYMSAIKIISNLLGETMSRIETETEINYLAYYDQITKLPNRVLFKRNVTQNIQILKKTDKHMGLMFIDLDSFKIVNETVGHGVGDELLFIVGKKLQEVIGEKNIISRFSGDKFTIMIRSYTSFQEMKSISNKIMNLFYEPFILKGQEFFMSASSGIAIYPKDGADAETLIMNADIAKYEAKELGRNQYVFCSRKMKDEIIKKNVLINYLYHALEKNELFLMYQPQVSIETGKIVGIESLVRWNNSKLGLLSPIQFIPLAEQTGLINPIGDWILETAIWQIKKWDDMGIKEIHMAVNISPVQLKNPKFTLEFEKLLKKVGLKPELLEIEITENVAISNFKEIVSILDGFKVLGISIAIDDFGSGYSSLGRIKMLSADCLKIDKQFIDDISDNTKDQAIGEAIIQFAKSMGSYVIAEGVETEAQYRFLKKAKCDYIQGYYFYKPMLSEELEVLLIAQKNSV